MKTILLYLLILISSSAWSQVKDVDFLGSWAAADIQGWYGDVAFNEVWGFVQDGKEYAVIGSANGTNIVKINDDNSMERVQFIDARYHNAIHRHFHDYNGYLYEVCDQGSSTLRIHDLSYLPDSVHMVYDDSAFLARSHNTFIDSSSGLLYACGVTYGSFDVPMRVLSLANPEVPTLVYDYNFVDYVHDVFVRNDTAYINAAFEGLRVANFANPSMPMPLGSLEFYIDKGYNHSGWLSEDGNTYVLCDETSGMRFKVLDVSDLSDIQVASAAIPPTFPETLPHNVHVKDGLAYFSYYNDGLQIYDINDPSNPVRVGYYDTYPESEILFRGAWGIYAFLPSGRLLVSDRKHGLFLLGYDGVPNLEGAEGQPGIFPNYVENGYAYFFIEQETDAEYVLSIYADNGALVDQIEGYGGYQRLDFSRYANGMYLFNYVEKYTIKTASGKFVINHP